MDGSADRQLEERPWFIVERWQAYRGEQRANLLRMLAILVFYGIHLYSAYRAGVVTGGLHRAITSVVIAWSLVVLLVFFCLHRRYFPSWLKYVSTVLDVILLSWIATLGAGPSSPVIVVYFVIIVLAAVRIRLRLVWCAAAACIVGYLFVAATAWNDWWGNGQFLVGQEEVAMVVAGLAATGVIVGQVVRCAREMTIDYASQVERSKPNGNEVSP
jgi:hypothetical protein